MNAQIARDEFWECFDKYLEEKGNPFYITHVKGGKNQNAGNINTKDPMAMLTISCEFKYLENIILVQFYINHKVKLFEWIRARKEEIENELGYQVEWIERGKIKPDVRRIQKVFYINKPYRKMIEEVFPFILDFIRVFNKYI